MSTAVVLPPPPAVGQHPPAAPLASEQLQALKAELTAGGNRTRIQVSDGRVFFGHFMCVDRDRNVVLGGSEEYRGDQRRFVGLVMIPGKHIMSVAVPAEDTALGI